MGIISPFIFAASVKGKRTWNDQVEKEWTADIENTCIGFVDCHKDLVDYQLRYEEVTRQVGDARSLLRFRFRLNLAKFT